jgi:subtilisin family serine protease
MIPRSSLLRATLSLSLALAFTGAALAGGSNKPAPAPAATTIASGASVSSGNGSGGDTAVPLEILVKLRSTAALPGLLQRYPMTLVDRFGARPIYRFKLMANVRASKDVLTALSTVEPDVLIAEANINHSSPEARRNMPWVIGDPGQYVAQWAPDAIRLSAAQQLSQGAGVRVAVLDTGIDLSHPALAGHLLPGFDFVDFDANPSEGIDPNGFGYGHGTHVAGLIAMVAPAAKIMPIRVLDNNGVGNAWVLAEALLFAMDPDGNPDTDDGAHIINLSLGSLTRTRLMAAISNIASCGTVIADDPVADQSDPGYADDIARCKKRKGAVIIAAAGNDGSASLKEYPAAEGAYGLLAVGASTSANRVAAFSNVGSWIGLAAPGEGLTSTFPGGGYATWSGTSMAAPMAAGTAALVQALDLSLPARDVVRRITRAAATLCGSNTPRLDALAAVTDTPAPATVCP